MRFARNKFKNSVLLWLAIGCLQLVRAFKAEAITLDWNSVNWTAGGLTQSFEIDATNPGNDITITVTDFSGRILSGTPDDTTTLQGGKGATEQSLQIAARPFQNDTQIFRVTIAFNYAAGVDFADFTLYDIDLGTGAGNTWKDQIRNIRGINSLTSTTTGANITALGSAVTLAGTAGNTNQTLTANANALDSSANGNATIDFGGKIITSITFDYGNAPGTAVDQIQWVGLADIHFRPKVPEVHPALAAVVVCGLAIGIRSRRRSQTS